jgi:beta-glucosidase/6-phospho-beta-glucosidase/beta-galactosidase
MTDNFTNQQHAVQTVMLGTGIECSYPKVENGTRRDQLEETKHYQYWREDFELCRETGARFVRYGPPYYKMHTAPHEYDWSFTDEVLPVMRDLGLIPILDLCHFGLPDWAGDFQNTDWAELFADFAEVFALRYPWIQYYTPVNEILVCAKFSGKLGIWNEQLKSDKAMITAHANMCRATLLSIERILKVRPDAVFFQSEAAEQLYERFPETRAQVEHLNEMRFMTFDFLYGHPPSGEFLIYLMDNGATKEMFEWFMRHGRRSAPHCVMGMDYYASNERLVHPDGREEVVGPVLGWHSIARQYYERYRRPMMLTETNSMDAQKAPDWMWKTWQNVEMLRKEGVPVLGYTWYSLQDQVDWDIQLREIKGKVNQNGLYNLERKPNPVAQAFKELCQRYSNLPIVESFPIGGTVGAIPSEILTSDEAE